MFKNNQLVSFGGIDTNKQEHIALVKKVSMNKKNTMLEDIKNSLIIIASKRQKKK